MKKKYSITGIDCANCAAKLEAKMNELPEVESVTLSFTTQQLYVEAENPDETVKALQALADKVEPGTEIGSLKRGRKKQKHIVTSITTIMTMTEIVVVAMTTIMSIITIIMTMTEIVVAAMTTIMSITTIIMTMTEFAVAAMITSIIATIMTMTKIAVVTMTTIITIIMMTKKRKKKRLLSLLSIKMQLFLQSEQYYLSLRNL